VKTTGLVVILCLIDAYIRPSVTCLIFKLDALRKIDTTNKI